MPIIPPTFALVIKLGVWALALCAFLAMAATRIAPADARTRRLLGAVLVGAFAGSKLLHGVEHGAPRGEALAEILLSWYGGDSVAGAIIGAQVACWLAAREAAERRVADHLVAPAGVALIILACGAMLWAPSGMSAGGATALPWGVDFGDGLARHPVKLYEALFLAILLWRLRGMERAPPGLCALLFVAAYLVFTVLCGFLRPPFAASGLAELVMPRPRMLLGLLSIEQGVCLLALGAMAPTLRAAWRARRGAPVRA